MTAPIVTPPFAEIQCAIDENQMFLVVAHVGPDGDAIGSGLALRMALESLGKDARLVSTDGVPVSCRFLPGWEAVETRLPESYLPECTFILDCDGSKDRVAAPFEMIENARCRVLIDHHRTARPIFEVNWIDVTEPATAQMVYRLLRALELPLTPDMAQCLMCGLSTDTGHFRFANTLPSTWRIAGELAALGADPAEVAFKLFDERSFESTRLLGLALSKMEEECDGDLIWTALDTEDFYNAGTGDEGSENVVNYLRNVRGARMALILRERCDETGPVARISVRSEPQLRADQFCAQFEGGGHAAAAGCRIRYKPFDDCVRRIIEAAHEWLRAHPPGRPV